MSTDEIVVTIGGLLLGYKIVNAMLSKKEPEVQKAKEFSTEFNAYEKDKMHHGNSRDTVDGHENQEIFIKENWFRILDISESASIAEISLQYKRKIREYHPDKVASLGKEIRELAELKSKEINSAYEFAKSIKAS